MLPLMMILMPRLLMPFSPRADAAAAAPGVLPLLAAAIFTMPPYATPDVTPFFMRVDCCLMLLRLMLPQIRCYAVSPLMSP